MTAFWCEKHKTAHLQGEDGRACLLVGPFRTKLAAQKWDRDTAPCPKCNGTGWLHGAQSWTKKRMSKGTPYKSVRCDCGRRLTMNPRGKKIEAATRRLIKAEDAMVKLLAKIFPEGTMIRCEIQHGQINPSHGTVIGHEGGRYGYIVVRLRSRTEHVRRVAVRDVW